MKKGKFGIVLCFYPIAAFAAAIFHSPLIAAALVAAAIFIERDEWTGRQTLQAWMLSAIVYFVNDVVSWALRLVRVPFLTDVLSFTSTALAVLITLAALVFSILGIIRVRKDNEANIPLLSDLAYRAYGQIKPKPIPVQAPAGYPQPSQPGKSPLQQQPMPPQGPYPSQYAPPQETPPKASTPGSTPEQNIQQSQNAQPGGPQA